MSSSSIKNTSLSRLTVVASVLAVAAGLLVALSDDSDAANPCRIRTSRHLDSSTHFASGGVLRRYTATAHGAAHGGYDQTAKIVTATYPRGAFPALINTKIGERKAIGNMVRQQRHRALAAINGDFFVFPDIGGEQDIEMSRGPMVRDGRIIRASDQRQRIVGVTKKRKPFGGLFAIRGTVQAAGSAPISIRSMNWQKVKRGGVNIYTSAWSRSIPRPHARMEWVLNGHNKIRNVRSPARNSGDLGNAVRPGTRVLAFSKGTAKKLRGMRAGTRVDVNIKQATNTGAHLLTAVGRGTTMVIGGTPAPLGCNAYDFSKAARPRTFVGWDAKGRWRSFTVPGKTFDGIGLRTGGFGLANAANIAESLGMRRAYELDGGGSTTLYTRSRTGNWTRRDLYGVNTSVCACERPMTNGLAFIKP